MLAAGKSINNNPVFVGNPGFILDINNKKLNGSLYTIPLEIHFNKHSSLERAIVYDIDKQKVIGLPEEISNEENRLFLSGYITALLTNK